MTNRFTVNQTALPLIVVCILSVGLLTGISDDHESKKAKSPGKIMFETGHEDYQAVGEFKNWRFTKVDIPDGDFEKGVVEIEIHLVSVSEKSPKLAQHLREPDFFHVEKFPTAKLSIKNAKREKDSNSYNATAVIDFHGFTKKMPVTFSVKEEDSIQIEGEAVMSRGLFKVGEPYQEGKRRSIADDVRISFSATLPETVTADK